MKFLAGLIMFVALAVTVSSYENHFETSPYGDGQLAQGVVVDNIIDEDGGYYSAEVIIEYTTRDGVRQESSLQTEGFIEPGTRIVVSYRDSDPSTVRAPSLRSGSAARLFIWPLVFLGGMGLFFNPITANRNKTLLNGKSLTHPEELLPEVKRIIEPSIGSPVNAAVPVILRRSISSRVIPFAGFIVGVLVLGTVAGLNSSAIVLLFCVPLVPMLIIVNNNQRGVMAVTEQEFVLVAAVGGDLWNTEIVGRIPRETALPRVRTYRYNIYGGPLPFETGSESKQWHYAASHKVIGGKGYYELIKQLVADANASAAEGPAEERTDYLEIADFIS